MPLTDAACRAATCPPDAKRKRYADSGGLYLEVSPAGSKRWFWKYRLNTAEKRMALGGYPEVPLSKARELRDQARVTKRVTGADPVVARKTAKLVQTVAAENSVRAVAKDWFDRQKPQWAPSHASRVWRRLERDIFPLLGERAMATVKPIELLAALRKIEERGALETADRCLQDCGQVWRFGVATARAERDIAADLKGALTPYRTSHFAAITDPKEFGVLIKAMRYYHGGTVVRAALNLSPLLLLRPGELRQGEWAEVDLDAAIWEIPGRRMKRSVAGKESGPPHLVPLPTQAVTILRELHAFTGHGKLMFPGERSKDRPISDNAVRTALLSLGYDGDTMTAHGFRATARTLLDERLGFPVPVIEAQLAHTVKDSLGRAYNRTEFIDQRRKMMQAWADYVDQLASGQAEGGK